MNKRKHYSLLLIFTLLSHLPAAVVGQTLELHVFTEDDSGRILKNVTGGIENTQQDITDTFTTDSLGHYWNTYTITGVNNDPVPVNRLGENYPNPFNPHTTIAYSLEDASDVLLQVFSVTGEKVVTLVDNEQQPGQHEATWDATNEHGSPVASGVYIYRLVADDFSSAKKMLYVKGSQTSVSSPVRLGKTDSESPQLEQDWEITASLDGYEDVSQSFTTADSGVDTVFVTLEDKTPADTLDLYVITHDQNGAPLDSVSGTMVNASQDISDTFATGENNAFTASYVINPSAGEEEQTWSVTASRPGDEPFSSTKTTRNAGRTRCS